MGDKPYTKYFQNEKEEKVAEKLFFKFLIILFVVYALIFTVASIYRANFEYVTIYGPSMQGTINPNVEGQKESHDGVYIKLTHNVDYEDIIVISKGKNEESIIKRALAFGGDYITIASIEYDGVRDYRFMRIKKGSDEVEILREKYIKSYDQWNFFEGQVVNGVEYEYSLYNNYVLNYNKKVVNMQLDGQDKEVIFFEIPQDHVFYMGDNRIDSQDARMTGTVNKEKILGYVIKHLPNGTLIKKDPVKWFFQSIGDFFSIVWREISIFFCGKA